METLADHLAHALYRVIETGVLEMYMNDDHPEHDTEEGALVRAALAEYERSK